MNDRPDSPAELSSDRDVRPLFREKDRNSMLKAFDLWSRSDVQAHQDAILERVRNGKMPCDGGWPPEHVAAFPALDRRRLAALSDIDNCPDSVVQDAGSIVERGEFCWPQATAAVMERPSRRPMPASDRLTDGGQHRVFRGVLSVFWPICTPLLSKISSCKTGSHSLPELEIGRGGQPTLITKLSCDLHLHGRGGRI
jgi:hypothetical protein